MPTRYTDYIVVVDLECLCWRDDDRRKSFPEIIEIGVCKLDTLTCKVQDKTSYLVKPRMGIVSDFCTELTTITQRQLEKDGIAFADAVSRISKKFAPRNRQWASYGEFDKIRFAEQCQFFQWYNPFSNMHRNVKDEYQIIRNWTKGKSLKDVCEELSIEIDGTLHRGNDDAVLVAKVLGKMIEFQRDGLSYYFQKAARSVRRGN